MCVYSLSASLDSLQSLHLRYGQSCLCTAHSLKSLSAVHAYSLGTCTAANLDYMQSDSGPCKLGVRRTNQTRCVCVQPKQFTRLMTRPALVLLTGLMLTGDCLGRDKRHSWCPLLLVGLTTLLSHQTEGLCARDGQNYCCYTRSRSMKTNTNVLIWPEATALIKVR